MVPLHPPPPPVFIHPKMSTLVKNTLLVPPLVLPQIEGCIYIVVFVVVAVVVVAIVVVIVIIVVVIVMVIIVGIITFNFISPLFQYPNMAHYSRKQAIMNVVSDLFAHCNAEFDRCPVLAPPNLCSVWGPSWTQPITESYQSVRYNGWVVVRDNGWVVEITVGW